MTDSTNPYLAPQTTQELVDEAREQASVRLRTPAFGLALVAAVTGLAALALVVVSVIMDSYYLGADIARSSINSTNQQFMSSVLIPIVIALYGFVQVIVFCGALQMLRLQSYRWAMTATVLAMLPQPSLIVSLPLGVWALWQLRQPGVRTSFAR